MTKKHLIMTVVAALALVGCTDDFNLSPDKNLSTETAISFAGVTGKTTRATGAEAAGMLNNSFVVYAFKTNGGDKQIVYDYYNVNYTGGSDLSSTTNTAGWEYVGQDANVLNTKLNDETQDIKYWDFNAQSYDFIAFSAGAATQVKATPASGQVQFSTVDNSNLTTKAYTITGATADLAKVYIADHVTANETGADATYKYKDAIKFTFKSLAANICIGLFETIPGYSVKDVKFYADGAVGTKATTAPVLYAGDQTIPSGSGKVNVHFDGGTNKVVTQYDNSGAKTQTLTLGALTANTVPEQSENGGNIYLGRTSSQASKTANVRIIPASAGALTLKIDFTLVSIDYNETIEVKGATATIPAQYTNWQSNYAYTYIFKLSDMMTDAFGQRLLYPVIFDAEEITNDWGVQQTITTIDQPSITTYAKGALGSDYYVGDQIYISVANGTAKMLTVENAKLYTVSTSLADNQITEKNISEQMPGITLIPVASDSSDFLTFTDHIDANDSPTGDIVYALKNNNGEPLSNFGKFTAAAGVYVFEYKESDPVQYDDVDDYNAVNGKSLTAQEYDALPEVDKIKVPAGYHYKVIRVVSGSRS